MNISLTNELESYVVKQVKTGHYKSASEVIREALRDKIRDSMRDQLNYRIKLANKEIENGEIIEANSDFFEKQRSRIKDKYSNNK